MPVIDKTAQFAIILSVNQLFKRFYTTSNLKYIYELKKRFIIFS